MDKEKTERVSFSADLESAFSKIICLILSFVLISKIKNIKSLSLGALNSSPNAPGKIGRLINRLSHRIDMGLLLQLLKR